MKPYLLVIGSIAAIGFMALLIYLGLEGGLPLLMPSGSIGIAERDLMVRTVFLMLIVVIPVCVLIILIAWRYRASNTGATYSPDWEHSNMEEFIWWVIPFEIVLVLGALTWSGTHALAPEREILSAQEPLVVQVVALPWKWLFIYPEQGVASVNELAIPVGRPVKFEVTADAPMNSFWIPALGGQIYAMSGMVTTINLIANESGVFVGKSANYSGEGFAQMVFDVHAVDEEGFEAWVGRARASSAALTPDAYEALATPGETGPVRYYGLVPMPFADIVRESMSTDEKPVLPTHH